MKNDEQDPVEVMFWIELQTTIKDMNKFTKSEDSKLVADILKKYSIDSTIHSQIKPIIQPTNISTENEEEVEDPYFHLRDGNYIGGLTMP